MCRIVGVLLMVAGAAFCLPAKDALMFEMGGDTAVVESTVREARQAPSHISDLLKPGVKNAFITTYGNKEGDVGNVQGYSKKMNDRGNEGYEHFDSFHKRDSDKYGFEVHREFGKSDKAGVEVGGKSSSHSDEDNAEDAEETKTLYRVSGETIENDKDKGKFAADGYDANYYEGGGDSDSYEGEGSEKNSDGGGSKNYEVNESYESGGSTSYEGGRDNDGASEGSYSSGKSSGSGGGGSGEKSQSYSKSDGDEEEEEDDD